VISGATGTAQHGRIPTAEGFAMTAVEHSVDPPALDAMKPACATGAMRVGVIGLGRIGQALAMHLLADRHAVVAYDRDPERVAALRMEGASGAAQLSGLAGCDVVISCLPDDAALASVAFAPGGLLDVLKPGATHVSTSTVSADASRRLAREHAARGQSFMVATILGNPDLARLRRIFMLLAGDEPVLARVRALLEPLCQRLFVVGGDPAAANVMKLACNALTAATLQSMGEVLAFLSKAGIAPELAFEVLTGSLFDGRVHKTYGGKIVQRRYSPPGMTVPLAVKDLRLALAEAEAHAVPMPVASLVHDRLVAVLSAGWANLDWSALGALAARDAGLDAMPAGGGR
jgi:3-hydroxyisobutyrate dehydrogenase-like beta-hydroxyacid dehydrogenase